MRIPKSELDFTLLRELVSHSPSGKPPEDTVAWPMLKHSGTDTPIFSKSELKSPGNNRQRIELYMKPRGSKESEKSKVLLRSHPCESADRVSRDNARHQIGMGILWLVLGTACAALALILLSILLK
jgi:hypothetical protein